MLTHSPPTPERRRWTRLGGAVLALGMGLALAAGLLVGVRPARAGGVVSGDCDEAALDAALAGGGSVTFDCGPNPITITLTSEKTIAVDTSIEGGGLVTLSGAGATRLFSVTVGATLSLANLTLRDGRVTDASGAGIYNDGGTVLITGASFLGNVVAGAQGGGGGIYNRDGVVSVSGSTFYDNRSVNNAGAIVNEEGTLTVTRSVFVSNTARYAGAINGFSGGGSVTTISDSTFLSNTATEDSAVGGALFNSFNNDHLTVIGSLFAGNSAPFAEFSGAGAIHNRGLLTLTNSTLYNNSTSGSGSGGLYSAILPSLVTNTTFVSNTAGAGGGNLNGSSTIVLKNSAVAYGMPDNCAGTIVDMGNNLQFGGGVSQSCGATIDEADPLLGAPQNNGGPTLTSAPAPNSPAVNAGDNAACPPTDQRGALRPQGGTCDIGAYEYGAMPTLTSLSPTSAMAGDPTLTLVLSGSNFISGSVALWNGAARATAFVSGAQLTTTLPASDLSAAGIFSVTVQNPGPGDGTSGALTFTVNNPLPTLTALDPGAVFPGSSAFTLTVTGTNFVSGSAVLWDGAARTTEFVSSAQLAAAILASDVATTGTLTVTVSNPTPGGGESNGLPFYVNDKLAQTITFDPLPDRIVTDPPFVVTATASSGLPVSFTAEGECSVLNNLVTLTGRPGSCTLTAHQPGDETYNPAPDAGRTFDIDVRVYLPAVLK